MFNYSITNVRDIDFMTFEIGMRYHEELQGSQYDILAHNCNCINNIMRNKVPHNAIEASCSDGRKFRLNIPPIGEWTCVPEIDFIIEGEEFRRTFLISTDVDVQAELSNLWKKHDAFAIKTIFDYFQLQREVKPDYGVTIDYSYKHKNPFLSVHHIAKEL
jgi:hypothetical protein